MRTEGRKELENSCVHSRHVRLKKRVTSRVKFSGLDASEDTRIMSYHAASSSSHLLCCASLLATRMANNLTVFFQ